jgi:outer membrane immunogenic protein
MNTQSSVAASASAFAAAAAATASGTAMAADLPSRSVAPALPIMVSSWQGFYVGGTAGVSWLHSSIDDGLALPFGYGSAVGSNTTSNSFGGTIGAVAGYNFQSRNMVFGLEGDFSWLGARSKGNGVNTTAGYYGGYSGATRKESRISALGTIRGRLGVDMNGTMPYLTAGVAFGDITSKYTFSYGGVTAISKNTGWSTGLVLGGGIEHKLTNNLSIRGEVLWIGFPDKTHAAVGYYGGNSGTYKTSNDLVLGRIGLNYHF